jgi:hypothetical protein
MIQKSRIKVASFDGLYDEKSIAAVHNISNRKFCASVVGGHHIFINASLEWGSRHDQDGSYFSIRFESKARENFNPEWGMGYGGIRFCQRCKLIECIHLWGESKIYEIEDSPDYSRIACVDTCRICNRRIFRSSYGSVHASVEASELIDRVAREFGWSIWDGKNTASGWILEFPCQVSAILRSRGTQAAEDFARHAFSCGEVSCGVFV